MAEVQIAARPRTEFGKGAARRIRRNAEVPAVLYGHGTDTRHYRLPAHELMLAIKHDKNVLLSLQIEGGASELAIPRAVVKDPIKGFLEHVDLLLVRRGEKVTVEVPVIVVGDAISGTIVELQITALPVETEATHIPTGFEVSVQGLDAGDAIHAGQVPLPDGVTLAVDPDAVVVHVGAQQSAAALEADLAAAPGADAVAATVAADAAAAAEAADTEA
ncbi:MAG TPA: 50S ribosomal protein L25/general stress protein Ctc [Mycobacteriales bacterium]|nr:50S ribosomal protein L25/general stress protein Ctc [Mycobacteriales bacterium]